MGLTFSLSALTELSALEENDEQEFSPTRRRDYSLGRRSPRLQGPGRPCPEVNRVAKKVEKCGISDCDVPADLNIRGKLSELF